MDNTDENKNKKMFLDYLGSYKDPQRATEEMKKTQSDESGTSKMYTNVNYDTAKPPPVKMTAEQQVEFEKQMKVKFGGMETLSDENTADEIDFDFNEELTPLELKQLKV